MLVEIKCPDCEAVHYFDISVSGDMIFRVNENEEVVKEYFFDNIQINYFVPTEDVQKYI